MLLVLFPTSVQFAQREGVTFLWFPSCLSRLSESVWGGAAKFSQNTHRGNLNVRFNDREHTFTMNLTALPAKGRLGSADARCNLTFERLT